MGRGLSKTLYDKILINKFLYYQEKEKQMPRPKTKQELVDASNS